jgi:hypothetical protein
MRFHVFDIFWPCNPQKVKWFFLAIIPILFFKFHVSSFWGSLYGPINKDDIIHAQWLKREGEETYAYYSDDQLITKVAEISLGQNADGNEPLILCPISAVHNKFIPRLCYDEVLKNSLDINDALGYPVEIKEGKRIIHFRKMSLKEAFVIYQDIIKTNPQNYECLQKFLDSEYVNNLLR